MKNTILFLSALYLVVGCASVHSENKFDEPKARDAAEWVRNRAGFIEAAVATITHVAVYSVEKDSVERRNILELLNIVSTKLNVIADGGNFNNEDIEKSLSLKEPDMQIVVAGILNVASFELKNFQKNGYAEFSTEILKAVTKGIADGSAQ